METYLDALIEEGQAIELNNRKRKLYNNTNSDDWYYYDKWNRINFQYPTTFDTLAMDPRKKKQTISGLDAFKRGKDYYTKIGKARKRGYDLHNPPGTGKSTMIVAIENYMDDDIYDLELTSVKDIAKLKQLLINTCSRSVIVIDDIYFSVALTRKCKANMNVNDDEDEDKDKEERDKDRDSSKRMLTLSGLLNFIDRIWSAYGQERIIIFTTKHVDNLDFALIIRGIMNMHIELSCCKFEAFQVLAKNYLGIHSYPLFGEIRQLLGENKVSPCDVAENLMPKFDSPDVEGCLLRLIEAIKAAAKQELDSLEDKREQKLANVGYNVRGVDLVASRN